jgi:YidC/Oxa1 family membrane protein insertase
MLLTEWVHFRQKAADTELAASEAPEQTVPAVADAIGTTAPTTAQVPTLPNAAATTGNRFVRVRTDVLDVQIDLHGGDIIKAALPAHSATLEVPDKPFVLLQQEKVRTYVAQSGLIGRDGTDTAAGRAQYSAEQAFYEMGAASELVVELTYTTADQVQIRKRFLFTRGNYLIGLNYRIDNNSDKPWQSALFGQLKRDDSVDPNAATGGLGMHSYLGAAAPTAQKTYEKLPFKDMKEKPLNEQVTGGWIGIIQHYFLSAWVPDQKTQNQLTTLVTGDNHHIVRFTSPTQEIAPHNSGEFNAALYVGPKDQYALREISPGLELSVDYGWLWMLAQPIFWLLTKIHGFLGNWGWSIVIVTLIVKILFFGLNAKAYKSMANMRKVQPKLLEIRERFADDKQKQSQEMMNLYKTEKINPLGGCLPILVQMPVFLALYWVLQESVELRHTPWILWIKDLSAMDPYLILPLLMGVTMFIQQKLNPAPPDPMQAKVMQWMPVMFTFFFLWFPAGLVLYWVVNNTLSIVQQYIITKRIEKA